MRLSTLLSLGLVAASAAIGAGVGGAVGLGLFAGTCLGASLSGFATAIQRRLVAERPHLVLPAFAAAFGAKLMLLFLLLGLVLLAPELARTLHPVALLLSFGASAILVLFAGAFEISSALRSAPRSSSQAASATLPTHATPS